MRNDSYTGFNEARRREVLGIVALWPTRRGNHVRVTVDKDGKRHEESAIKSFLCSVCHKSEDEIMCCRDGEKCSAD